MSKVIFLTGGTGYIGNAVANRLASLNYSVHVLIRKSNSTKPNISFHPNIVKHTSDTNEQGLEKIISQISPTILINIAGYFTRSNDTDVIDRIVDGNLTIGLKILNCAIKCGVPNVINVGSKFQLTNDGSVYTLCKSLLCSAIDFHCKNERIRATTLFLYDVYGPNDERPKIIPGILKTMDQQSEPLLIQNKNATLKPVHIDDICNAFEISVEEILSRKMYEHKKFKVFDQEAISIEQIMGLLRTLTKKNFQVEFNDSPETISEAEQFKIPLAKLDNWSSKVSFTNGLKRLLNENQK